MSKTMISESSSIQSMQHWLAKLEQNEGLDTIDPDADLIENAYLDSMQFINFLMLIEELRQASIKAQDIQLKNFRTLRIIYNTFLSTGV